MAAPVPKGGVLLLTNRTPHASFENKTDIVRWSMDLRYQSAALPTNAQITRLPGEARARPPSACPWRAIRPNPTSSSAAESDPTSDEDSGRIPCLAQKPCLQGVHRSLGVLRAKRKGPSRQSVQDWRQNERLTVSGHRTSPSPHGPRLRDIPGARRRTRESSPAGELRVGEENRLQRAGPWRPNDDPSICQSLPTAFFDALGLPRLAAGS